LPSVQRKVHHAVPVDHLRNGVLLGFDHAGAGRNFHAFGKGADLHRHVDLDAVAHLQNNAGLHVAFESGRRHFQPIRPHRQIGNRVAALLVGSGVTHGLFLGLDNLDLGSDNGPATGVGDLASDFGHSHRLRKTVGDRNSGGHYNEKNGQENRY